MRPLRLNDLTRQKLSQKTVREQLEPSPRKRRVKAATHTGMHVPVFREKVGLGTLGFASTATGDVWYGT